ncbi:MAG: hypothetical protein ABIP85_06490, partial [Chthoniobacteraceae bacterium]
WRMAQFGTYANTGNSADTADPDGDGWTNAQEYIFGTNPKTNDYTSLVTIAATGGNLTITFVTRQTAGTGYSGLTRYYTVETNNDLTNSAAWTPLAGYTDIPASGQNIQVIIPIATAPRFYRLKVRLQ